MKHNGGDVITSRGIRSFANAHQWATVRQLGTRVPFQPRRPILSQGEAGTTVVLFLSGRVKVAYTAPDGSHTLLSIRGPGDLVGEVACTAGEVRTATVSALEAVEARVIQFGEFTDVVRRFGWGQMLQRYWADRFRQACQRTWRIPGQAPQRKIASLFAAMMDADGRSVSVPMTQEEIANSLGLSRRTVWAVLDGWRGSGWIDVARSRIDIADPAAIRALLPHGM